MPDPSDISIARGVRGPCNRVVLRGCGHAPWREREAATTAAVLELARAALAR